MSQLTEEQARRLEKLNSRRPTASRPASPVATSSGATRSQAGVAAAWDPPQAGSAVATAMQPIVDWHTNVNVVRSGSRHTALAAKFVTTGLAASGFLGAVGSLAMDGAAASEAAAALPGPNQSPPSTVVVLETVHNVVYVDEFGNPVAPPTTTVPDPAALGPLADAGVVDPLVTLLPGTPVLAPALPTAAPAAGTQPGGTQPPGATVPRAATGTVGGAPSAGPIATGPVASSPGGTSAPAVAPIPTAPTPAVPTGAAPTPTIAPGTSSTPTATTAAPAPAASTPTVAPTPPPPVVTQPPAPPPTTTAPAPPPTTAPAPPACTGSACP